MGSVVLVLLASSMGVMFGWQPMPDGSPRYEYVVQIEPELAATLQEGQSIPITSDIPPEIGPIGRIRIVVGRDELPRQQLITRMKPLPKNSPGEGIVETQYTVPPVQPSGTGRYGENTTVNNNAILPPNDNQAAGANPLGRALQQGAQEARNLLNNAKQPILPPNEELFGGNSAVSPGVRNAIENTANHLRQGANEFVDKSGQQVRQAVDNVTGQVQNSIDQFANRESNQRTTFGNIQQQPANAILPPSTDERPAGNALTVKQQPGAASGSPSSSDLWQGRSNVPATTLATAPNTSQDQITNQASPAKQPFAPRTPFESKQYNSANSRYKNNPQPPATSPKWPRNSQENDPFDVASRGSDSSRAGYLNNRQPNNSQAEYSMANRDTSGPQLNSASRSSDQSYKAPPPEINSNMLKNSAEDQRRFAADSTVPQPHTVSMQKENQPQQTNNGQNKGTLNEAQGNNAQPYNGDNPFPLVISWVLLAGSVSGNAYLFWSYLDVRGKYKGIVHGASGGYRG